MWLNRGVSPRCARCRVGQYHVPAGQPSGLFADEKLGLARSACTRLLDATTVVLQVYSVMSLLMVSSRRQTDMAISICYPNMFAVEGVVLFHVQTFAGGNYVL